MFKNILRSAGLVTLLLGLGFNHAALALGAQTGVVEAFAKDKSGSVITISGKRYQVDKDVKVSVGDTSLSFGFVDLGQEVRYTLHFPLGTGATVDSLTIIGPPSVLKELEGLAN